MNRRKGLRQTKKHKPASLKYSISRFSDYHSITVNKKTKVFVYMNLVNALKSAIEEKAEIVDLFKLDGTGSCIAIQKDNWRPALNKAMEFFTEEEMFETCAECKKLIDTITHEQ